MDIKTKTAMNTEERKIIELILVCIRELAADIRKPGYYDHQKEQRIEKIALAMMEIDRIINPPIAFRQRMQRLHDQNNNPQQP